MTNWEYCILYGEFVGDKSGDPTKYGIEIVKEYSNPRKDEKRKFIHEVDPDNQEIIHTFMKEMDLLGSKGWELISTQGKIWVKGKGYIYPETDQTISFIFKRERD